MPHVVNGIGTWYWGKDRIHIRNARCEYCGNVGELRSYDTTLFFVVVFIPVIPLGRKRVLNDCPNCRKHSVVALKKWMELQEKTILEADQAAMAEPKSEEKAAAAIGAATGFQAQEEFGLLARKYGERFPHGPIVQAVLGDSYVQFGMAQEAEQAYLKSLKAKDDPAVHEALALLLIRSNRPADAEGHVTHVIEQKVADSQGLPLLVAAGYQAQGMHEDALRLLESTQAAFPALASEREFTDLQKTSNKHRATGKAVRGKLAKQMSLPKVREGGWRGKLPRLIPTAIFAIAAAWYLGTAVKLGFSRPVHVVNGLDRAYVADINGTKVSIGPHGRKVVNLPEGDITIRVADEPQAPSQTIRMSTPFFSRPFSGTVHVINPDGTALLVREQTAYTVGGGGGDLPFTLHVGEFYYAIPSVDYVFEDFPSSLKLSSDSSTVTKTRVDMADKLNTVQIVSLLLGRKERERSFAVIRNRLALGADDETLLMVAVQLMPADQVEAILKPRIAARPVLLQTHRAYQELIERVHPEQDLRGEYDRMLKAEPNNGELIYLLGRVTDDREQAKALFERAASAAKQVPYAFHALAYEALIHGEFESSLNFERKALVLSPQNDSFKSAETDSLMALGRFDEILKSVRANQAAAPLNQELVTEELYLLARMGDPAGAARRAAEYYERIRKVTSEQDLVNLRMRHNAMLAYLRGDTAEYQRNLRAMPPDLEPFEMNIELRRFDAAMQLLKDAPASSGESYALIYLAATEAKDDSAAKAALDASIKDFVAGSKAERAMARWLKGEATPTAQELADLSMRVESKRIMLTVLGLRIPAVRAPAFALARKLNYRMLFPYRLIDRLTAQP